MLYVMDHVSRRVRSKIMASVRRVGTRPPNCRLPSCCGRLVYGGKHWPVAGKPDFAWPGRKVAVFVGWLLLARLYCKYLPRTNTEFWRNKIETNKRGDRRVTQSLGREGWIVIRVKECAVRKPATLARLVRIVQRP
jgi:DNA mismatch endonuclease (patch repair protein)